MSETKPKQTEQEKYISYLHNQLQTYTTVLGVLINRASGTLIIKRNQFQDFENKRIQRGKGKLPNFTMNPQGKNGDISLVLKWPDETVDMTPQEPTLDIDEVLFHLEKQGVKVSEEIAKGYTQVQLQMALDWATAAAIKSQGGDVDVPEKPAFLP